MIIVKQVVINIIKKRKDKAKKLPWTYMFTVKSNSSTFLYGILTVNYLVIFVNKNGIRIDFVKV